MLAGMIIANPQPARSRISDRLGPGGPNPRGGAAGGAPPPRRGPKLKPYIMSTGTGPFALLGVVSVISMLTSIDGQVELSTRPLSCFSTTGISPTIESRVSATDQVTLGTFGGIRP